MNGTMESPSGITTPSVTVPEESSEVGRMLNSIREELDLLHNSLSTLYDRLSTVVREPQPTEEPEKVPCEEPTVVLARRLHEYAAYTSVLRQNVDDVLGRLEL